jgi:hypothetical protein
VRCGCGQCQRTRARSARAGGEEVSPDSPRQNVMTDRSALLNAITAYPDEDTASFTPTGSMKTGPPTIDCGRDLSAYKLKCRAPRNSTRSGGNSSRRRRNFNKDLTRRGILSTVHLQKRVAGSVGYERGFLAEADAFYTADPIQTVRFAQLSARPFRTPRSASSDRLTLPRPTRRPCRSRPPRHSAARPGRRRRPSPG